MYKLPYFTEEDTEKVIAFMKENSFAVITGFAEQFPVATHIPLSVEIKEDGKMFLYGHLMKNTEYHRAFKKNENVLVVFNGPHTYVSASWYTDPRVASTWNYMAVHAKGKITFTDEEGTYQAIKAITNKYEGTGSAASFDQLPKEYIAKLIKAIVGFSIEVESFDNVFKLSQNHHHETRQNIAAHLQAKGDEHSTAIAKEMEKRYS
ncbi:MAG: FMN-binding negative transcriptional regulator [Ferruginibacter sp.]|nr:FMN-binding negative transcriptional regulator [Ferruginibacter sp.]